MKKLIPLLLLAGCAHGALTTENDFFDPFDKNNDRAYTHGTKFSSFTETEEEKKTYSIGQNIYTPDTKKPDPDPAIIAQSRPYSGWLYGEYRDSWNETETIKDTVGIQVGCTGKCSLARQTQQGVHKLLDQGIPTWDPQYTLKTEAGLILEGEKYYELLANSFSDLVGYGSVKAGNLVDNGAGGIEYRIGYNLDHFESEPIIFKAPEVKPSDFLGYFFIKGEERLVAYTYFLQGSIFHDETHTVTPEVSVQELDAGITLGYDHYQFTYRYTAISDEWTTQKGNSAFGGLNFSW